MPYIFLDESGDLGFDFSKKKTSKFFVVTFLFLTNKRPIEKVIRSLHKELRKKYKIRSNSLHAYHEEPVTCLRFYRKLITKDCKIMTIYLNKQNVYTRMQEEKAVLYNYVANILLDRIMKKRLIDKSQPIVLVASRRETNKFLNLNFRNYLSQQMKANHNLKIVINIKAPHEEKALQAVDMVSWAIYRKYEFSDDSYYSLIKDLIVEERSLFP